MRWSNHFQRSSLTLVVANSFISLPRSLRKASELISTLLTPTIANFSGSSWLLSRLYSAGISRRLVKSPVAPKMTKTHESPRRARGAAADWEVESEVGMAGNLVLFLEVSAELVAHRGKQFVREVCSAARSEAFVERRGQHVRRNAFVDCSVDSPSALARVGDAAAKFLQLRIAEQRVGSQVEQ